MDVNTDLMAQCVERLENNSTYIIMLCEMLEENLTKALHFMDKESSVNAVYRMRTNIENVRKNVPVNDEACQRLILALRHIMNAGQVFGR